MSIRKLFYVTGLVLLVSTNLYSQESSVYLMGAGGSFSPLLPPTGISARSLTGLYWASQYADKNGDKSKVVDNIYGVYQQFMVQYVTRMQLVGGKYVIGGMLPFATAETNPSNSFQIKSRLFMADPFISPIGLSWQKPDYQIFAEYRLYLPWGQYDANDNFNIGKGQYSHIISLSSTVFFDQFKKWSATIIPRYEFHGERKDSNIKSGSYFNLEWGITNSQHETMDFGFVGYASFQLTQDTGSGVPPDIAEVKDRVIAIGAEWGILARKINMRFALRGNFELYGVDRPIGTMLTLDIHFFPAGMLFDE